MARTGRKPAREPLSRERIEEAALDLIDREGFGNFSTRKLAGELGCEAMSIYHYFPSKAHLADALLDRVISTIPLPDRSLPWDEQLRQSALSYRAMILSHPRFAEFIVLHRMNTRVGLALLERFLQPFRDAGFDVEMTARLFRTFGYYVAGAALDEAAGYSKGPSAVEPVPEEVARRDFPLITAVNPYFRPSEHKATFDLGLDMMIAGIAARLPRKAVRSGGPPSRA